MPRKTPTVFRVPVTIAVEAKSAAEASEEVAGLVQYAFDVSNDEGRFKRYLIADESNIEIDGPA